MAILFLIVTVVHAARSRNNSQSQWPSSVKLTAIGLLALGFLVAFFDGSIPALQNGTEAPPVQQAPVVTNARPAPPPSNQTPIPTVTQLQPTSPQSNSAPIPQAKLRSEWPSQPYQNSTAQSYGGTSSYSTITNSANPSYASLVTAMEIKYKYDGTDQFTRCNWGIPKKSLETQAEKDAWVQLLNEANGDAAKALEPLIKLQCRP